MKRGISNLKVIPTWKLKASTEDQDYQNFAEFYVLIVTSYILCTDIIWTILLLKFSKTNKNYQISILAVKL